MLLLLKYSAARVLWHTNLTCNIKAKASFSAEKKRSLLIVSYWFCFSCAESRRTLPVMTDEVGTGAAAKNYIRNKRQLGLLMTIGDVNDDWRKRERERGEKRMAEAQWVLLHNTPWMSFYLWIFRALSGVRVCISALLWESIQQRWLLNWHGWLFTKIQLW